MKNKWIRLILSFGLVYAFSCEKDLLTRADYADYTFSSLDEKGGS